MFFHSKHNLISKIIESFENSPISHTGICLKINDEPYVLHSAWAGVQLVPISYLLKSHTIVYEYEVVPDITKELMKVADQHIGDKYDTLGLFGYMAVWLGRKIKLGIHNPLASKSAAVCSRFVIQADVENLIPEFHLVDPEDIMPTDLLDICKNSNNFKLVEPIQG